MFSLSIWNIESEFTTFAYLPPLHPVYMGLTSDFILISTSEIPLQKFEISQFEVPQKFSFSDSVVEISCNSNLALILTPQSVWMLGCDINRSGLFGLEGIYESTVPVKVDFESKNNLLSACLAENHAAVLCTEGLLFTWGTGHNGELGHYETATLTPTLLNKTPFFKGQKVITGDFYTAIITQGGYLYIYGKNSSCTCSSSLSQPYTIPSLESHFVSSATKTTNGLALLTNAGKIYLTKGCLCINHLQTNKKIIQIVSNSSRIFALSSDKTRLYCWEYNNGEYRNTEFFHFKPGKIFNLVSAPGPYLGVFGLGLDNFPGEVYDDCSSPEPSPKYCEQDKKSIELILGKYKFTSSFSQETIVKEEACKEILHFFAKYLAECFRKVKEFAYAQKMMQRAYSNSLTLNILVKVCMKADLANKKFAFMCIDQVVKGQDEICEFNKNSGFVQKMKKMMKKTMRKKFLIILKKSEFRTYIKSCGKSLGKLKWLNGMSVLNGIKNTRHPIFIMLRVLEIKQDERMKKGFERWAGLVQGRSRKDEHYLKSQPSTQCKYGLCFLSASICKLQTKQKSYSFNSILRRKSRQSCFSVLLETFQHIVRPMLSYSFHQIRLKSITQKHKKIIHLMLSTQSLIEKLRYRMIIKGFNTFKKILIYKPAYSDLSSEGSFVSKSFFRNLRNSNFELLSPERTMPNTERSTLETSTGSSARKGSLHRIEPRHQRKYSDKIQSEPKSSLLSKNKLAQEKNNAKSKESRLDKRMAYDEALKERQRKKLMGKGANSISALKNSSQTVTLSENFNRKNWVNKKYCNAVAVIEKIINGIVNKKVRLPFNLLKYNLNSKNVEIRVGKDKRNNKELHILTKNLSVPRLEIEQKIYDSPVESPISNVNEDTFILPSTPFVEMISPKGADESQLGLWKIKLYTLGLNKFCKTLKQIAKRKTILALRNSVI